MKACKEEHEYIDSGYDEEQVCIKCGIGRIWIAEVKDSEGRMFDINEWSAPIWIRRYTSE